MADEDAVDAALAHRVQSGASGAPSFAPLSIGSLFLADAGVAAAVTSGNVQLAQAQEHMELTKARGEATARHLQLTSPAGVVRHKRQTRGVAQRVPGAFPRVARARWLIRGTQTRRRARSLAVPTDDKAVRAALRARDQPVTLFGEREMERRERLRALLASLDEADGGELPAPVDAQLLSEAPAEAELFYTEGSDALLTSRLEVAAFSLRAAAARLSAARARAAAGLLPLACTAGEAAAATVAALSCEASCLGDDRPLSAAAFSPSASRLLTGGWTGCVQLWTGLEQGVCNKAQTLRAHDERISGVAWHPHADGDAAAASDAVAFATGACDKLARLWSAQGTLLRTLSGHTDRLGRVAFHPAGSLLGTASFDATWRLWDVATGVELLCQEGHSRAVYCVAFQPDGSLALSGGLEGHARVWDLRTGRSVLLLRGHVRSVLAADWSPDGHTAATGAGDNAARIWDIRAAGKCAAVLPAHAALLTAVRFDPSTGGTLLTASHDGLIKLWAAPGWGLLRAMRGAESRVMAADLAPGAASVAAVSYDRTVKLWTIPTQPGDAVADNGGGKGDGDAVMQEGE